MSGPQALTRCPQAQEHASYEDAAGRTPASSRSPQAPILVPAGTGARQLKCTADRSAGKQLARRPNLNAAWPLRHMAPRPAYLAQWYSAPAAPPQQEPQFWALLAALLQLTQRSGQVGPAGPNLVPAGTGACQL
jgi:hypothetical protein